MDPLKRRDFLALAAVPVLLQRGAPPAPAPGSIFVCMHQASSERFDFKTAMEGYAKVGIRAVEPNLLRSASSRRRSRRQQRNGCSMRDGELHHLHFEDVPADPPREIQGQPHRAFPGGKGSRRCAGLSRC